MPKTNMYSDSVKQWNIVVGCEFDCVYCKKSFQAQMKRQKPRIDKNGIPRGCQFCYDYEPHFHPERLWGSLPNTKGDEFIWCCSSGDIYFAEQSWIHDILERIEEMPHKTFFFQTKNPDIFCKFNFPKNVLLGITLESNIYYPKISNAPSPWHRYVSFKDLDFPRKVVTIEPILKFRHEIFLKWLVDLNLERIYIGYDTKKNNLPEPSIHNTLNLIKDLRARYIKVKTKYMKEEKNDKRKK